MQMVDLLWELDGGPWNGWGAGTAVRTACAAPAALVEHGTHAPAAPDVGAVALLEEQGLAPRLDDPPIGALFAGRSHRKLAVSNVACWD